MISTTVDAKAGQAYTVAGTGLSASLGLTVLNDQLDLPPAGKAAVRCINGAVSASAVDIGQADKQPWATGVKFATNTPYTRRQRGHLDPAGHRARQAAGGPAGHGRPELDLLRRAAGQGGRVQRADHPGQRGSQVAPVGGVETGFGGTTPDPLALLAFGTAAVALGAVAALTAVRLVAGVRRARTR